MLDRSYIDPTASVAAGATVGAGTKIWAFTRVADAAVIGKRCQLGQNVYVDRQVRMGDRIKVQNNVSIYKSVEIGDGVFLGPSCVFTNVEFPRAFVERKDEFRSTFVERGVTIGANATIVCGVRLHEFSFIGAGSVVVHDVVEFGLVVGNPARRIGWVCACGDRLPGGVPGIVACHRCGLTYHVNADVCRPSNQERFDSWWAACMDDTHSASLSRFEASEIS